MSIWFFHTLKRPSAYDYSFSKPLQKAFVLIVVLFVNPFFAKIFDHTIFANQPYLLIKTQIFTFMNIKNSRTSKSTNLSISV